VFSGIRELQRIKDLFWLGGAAIDSSEEVICAFDFAISGKTDKQREK
jgi:hypothetical protein